MAKLLRYGLVVLLLVIVVAVDHLVAVGMLHSGY